MRRTRLSTILMLLVIAGSDAACVHATTIERESSPFVSSQTVTNPVSPSCVPTAAMPVFGLKPGAPKALPPEPQYNMPVIRLSACYLESDSGTVPRLIPSRRDTIPPRGNQE